MGRVSYTLLRGAFVVRYPEANEVGGRQDRSSHELGGRDRPVFDAAQGSDRHRGRRGSRLGDEHGQRRGVEDRSTGNVVSRIIPAGDSPIALAVGEGGLWVANEEVKTVSRVDPYRA
jgi:streptogramin lyase